MKIKTLKISAATLVCFFVALSLIITSCGGKGKSGPLDDPTSGRIHITVDESYQPLMEAEIQLFESLYPHADIQVTYTNETQAFKDLLNDSSRFILVNRDLNDSEKEYFKKIELTTQKIPFAYDGLAFITNTERPINKLLFSQVNDLFTGKIATWDQLNSKLAKDSIRIIFDHSGSGNVRFISDTFKLDNKLPANCFAVNSNTEVINYVEKNKNAIGIISVNWISDDADTTALSFLKKIKVLAIGSKEVTDTTGEFRGPYQGYIAEGSYPFKRTAYIISREARAGLGTGFASFLTGEKGQRVVLRSGMVPATMPVRLVEISNQ